MFVVRVLMDQEFRGGDPRAEHALGVDVIAADGQAAERAAQIFERQSRVEQGAKRHVSGNTGKAVEVQDPAHSCPISLKLQYRASPRMM